MGRFTHLVDSLAKIKAFKERYHIPEEEEVIIPMIAFIEGRMTLPIGRITWNYLRNHRLYPTNAHPICLGF